MTSLGTQPNTSWTVGSAPGCDIVVSQPGVSGKHCRLSFHGGQYQLEDLDSTNDTFVNGHRLKPHSAVAITAGDQVTLAGNVSMPWPASPQHSEKSPSAQTLTIGRGPECEICLDYPMISRQHARITHNGKQWIIEDLKSLNGIALNTIDNKIQRAILESTDEIYLGSYKISASRILKEQHLVQGEGAFERVRFQGDRMVMGRDPAAEYPLT